MTPDGHRPDAGTEATHLWVQKKIRWGVIQVEIATPGLTHSQITLEGRTADVNATAVVFADLDHL